MGEHSDPKGPKEGPLDPSKGGTGSNPDENRESGGAHAKPEKD
jgi:hypothetical protein